MEELFKLQTPTITVVKIDVDKQSIYSIEIENTLQAKYDAIGNDCRLIEIGTYLTHNNPLADYRDVMYVDEESLLKWSTREEVFNVGIFKFAGFSNIEHPAQSIIQTFVGSAIIVGTDNDGNTTSCNVSLSQIRNRFFGFYKEVKWKGI